MSHIAEMKPSFLRPPSRVAIRRAADYGADLFAIVHETMRELGVDLRKKVVLLKPNLIGADPHGMTNTHPAVIAAAREACLRLGAAHVLIGDGPATDRDTTAIIESMRLREYTGRLSGVFVDLNLDNVHRVPLATRASRLKQLWLPRVVCAADYVISLPKMKTHHWAGVTLSMKNMFGIVPGACYGWPKNILHWAGIDRAILDLNATMRPDFAIVDGIVGMEGNGPIDGQAKHCGVVVMGDDVVAVDATCARVMGLTPEKVPHLARAATMLGNIEEAKILQFDSKIGDVRTPFAVVDTFRGLRAPDLVTAISSSRPKGIDGRGLRA